MITRIVHETGLTVIRCGDSRQSSSDTSMLGW